MCSNSVGTGEFEEGEYSRSSTQTFFVVPHVRCWNRNCRYCRSPYSVQIFRMTGLINNRNRLNGVVFKVRSIEDNLEVYKRGWKSYRHFRPNTGTCLKMLAASHESFMKLFRVPGCWSVDHVWVRETLWWSHMYWMRQNTLALRSSAIITVLELHLV